MKTVDKAAPKKSAKKTAKKVVKLPLKKKLTLEQRVSTLEVRDNLTATALDVLWKVSDDLDNRVFANKEDIETLFKELENTNKNITALGYGVIILTVLFVVSIIV